MTDLDVSKLPSKSKAKKKEWNLPWFSWNVIDKTKIRNTFIKVFWHLCATSSVWLERYLDTVEVGDSSSPSHTSLNASVIDVANLDRGFLLCHDSTVLASNAISYGHLTPSLHAHWLFCCALRDKQPLLASLANLARLVRLAWLEMLEKTVWQKVILLITCARRQLVNC